MLIVLRVASGAGAREWQLTPIARTGDRLLGAQEPPVRDLHPRSINEAGEVGFPAQFRFPAPPTLRHRPRREPKASAASGVIEPGFPPTRP